MRLNDSHLTFGKIADEWSRELAEAKVPGRRERDEIFLTFLRGALAGQFDDKGVTLAQARKDVYSEQLKDKGSENVVHRFNVQPLPMPITGEWLAQAQMVPTPRPGVRRPDTGPDPWYPSEGLNLDDFDPLFVSCYIEPLTISKDAFGDWCEQFGHARPAFWFPQLSNDHTPPSVDELQLREQAEKDWYARLVEIGITQEPNSQNTKDKLFQKAYSEDGLSQRAFDNLWRFAMPTKFKKGGARKTSP